jgi:hypothetical protein
VSAERLLALVGLVVALLLLARFGPPAWRSWRILSGVKTRRLQDAGPLEIPPPEMIRPFLSELAGLGFSRIGERWLQLPGRPISYEWVVGEPSGETYVVVVPSIVLGGALVACYSSFDDSTWVQTNYPRGAVVERPTFVAGFVPTSVTDAVAAHRLRVNSLRPAHGQPRRILTMADTLRMDVDYRTHHGGSTLRTLTARNMTPALGAAALAVIFAVLLLLAR